MTRTFVVLLAFASLTGCAGEFGPIILDRLYVPSAADACRALPTSEMAWNIRAELEVTSETGKDPAPGLLMAFRLSQSLGGTTSALSAGGTTLQPTGVNEPVLDRLIIQLTAQDGVTALAPKRIVPIVARFDDDGLAMVGWMDVIGTEAGRALQGMTGEFEMSVGIEFQGHMSESRSAISTGVVSFPVGVKNVGACTTVGRGNLCLGAGTDASAPACCDGAVGSMGC